MKTAQDKQTERVLKRSIERLSDPRSYNTVCHEHRMGEPMPSTEKLQKIIDLIREILFPGYFGDTSLRPSTMAHYMGVYVDTLYKMLNEQILAGLCFMCEDEVPDPASMQAKAVEATIGLIAALPDIRRKLVNDVEAAYLGDPAARSYGEVIFCYPAVRAISNYRIAHELSEQQIPIIPRAIAEMAHSETGIDIHPRAKIGEYFTIDHGTGVVIGSTCIIGNRVKIYQGVTLGAKSFPLDEKGMPIKGIPRHPIIEDNVIIYAGATLLGRIRIGKNSIIGGNVWVTGNLPPNSKVLQFKARETTFNHGGGI